MDRPRFAYRRCEAETSSTAGGISCQVCGSQSRCWPERKKGHRSLEYREFGRIVHGIPLNHRQTARLARSEYLSVTRGIHLFPFLAPRYTERVLAPLSCARVFAHSDSMIVGRKRSVFFERADKGLGTSSKERRTPTRFSLARWRQTEQNLGALPAADKDTREVGLQAQSRLSPRPHESSSVGVTRDTRSSSCCASGAYRFVARPSSTTSAGSARGPKRPAAPRVRQRPATQPEARLGTGLKSGRNRGPLWASQSV